ncbi:hydrogen peroxide-inducible genes activator [Labrenzia sp. PHM005]|uniref:hydrogen peroxide-inducible genes activator n=1 Tax=Labrenzia sp. PHM005 TaxID=2590016 RepID=UPI00113FE5C1|nr:hydrogen peroxide-inducible genes activator [Labrenzia sp. PHM005]QDG77200.1 hydrogen peroxide-inducible genes activator [Labrenzia sp. PHM005]
MGYRPSARQLEYFIALAECTHFGKAAKTCYVSQPTLSHQFKLLEEGLETSLLERGAAGISLTAAGERLLPLARRALEALDDFVTAAEAGRENLGGLIRLGVPSTFGPYFMPYLLPILKSSYPGLELYIREDRPAVLEQQILDGSLDCIISPDLTGTERLQALQLCREELSLAVPRSHPLAGLDVIPVEMLGGERLLTLSQGFRLHDDVQALAHAAGAEFRQDYEGTSLDALRQMVSIGMGLCLFPAAYIASEFGKEPDVLLKNVADANLSRTICIAWRRESARSEHFEELFELSYRAVVTMQVPGIVAIRSS